MYDQGRMFLAALSSVCSTEWQAHSTASCICLHQQQHQQPHTVMQLCSPPSGASLHAWSSLQSGRRLAPFRHSLTPQFKATSSPIVTSKCTPGRRSILQPPAAAAAAATLSYDSLNSTYLSDSRAGDAAAAAKPVPPLPTPPTSSSDWGVLPYLWELAMAEKQMSWRIGAAFTCMLMSKAAGRWLVAVLSIQSGPAAECIHACCTATAFQLGQLVRPMPCCMQLASICHHMSSLSLQTAITCGSAIYQSLPHPPPRFHHPPCRFGRPAVPESSC